VLLQIGVDCVMPSHMVGASLDLSHMLPVSEHLVGPR
jgi:hypothetical protein